MFARRLLNNYFSCHSKINILRTVAATDKMLSGRQIAAQAGLSPRSCQLSLDELVKLSALKREIAGKAYYYSLNRQNHIVSNLVLPIIEQEERLIQSIIEMLQKRFTVHRAAVQGIYYLESWPKDWAPEALGALLLVVLRRGENGIKVTETLKSVLLRLLKEYGVPADFRVMTAGDFGLMVRDRVDEAYELEQRSSNILGPSLDSLIREERSGLSNAKVESNFFKVDAAS